MELIRYYFPALSEQVLEALEALKPQYEYWNQQINVISRKDMESFYEHHVLHSLVLYKMITFKPGTTVADIGTGGGFPGIPLSIVYPQAHFTLIDSVKKKLTVVRAISKALRLTNISIMRSRAENVNQQFDFVLGRAVTPFPNFVSVTKNNVRPGNNHSLKNGIFYWKGGDLSQDRNQFKNLSVYPLSNYFFENYFETKYLIYLPITS